MNREKALLIKNKIQDLLQELSKSENLNLEFTGISFSNSQLNLKMQLSETDQSKIDCQNTLLSKRYGFSQNIVGMEFKSNITAQKFVITGFKTANRKYPVTAKRISDGQSYKFTPDQILMYLGGNKLINRETNLKNLLDQI